MTPQPLDRITLICADTACHSLAYRALRKSLEQITPRRAIFFTDIVPIDDPPGAFPIETIHVDTLTSVDAYSQFMIKGLAHHIETDFVLIVQWDGFVLGAAQWRDSFYDHDYIGAPWSWHPEGMQVGNGGFSLRSKKLLEALQDSAIDDFSPEDSAICHRYRALLDSKYGIRFAPADLAAHFSFERSYPKHKTFGFHGVFNFFLTLSDADLDAFIEHAPVNYLRKVESAELLGNLGRLGRKTKAMDLARKLFAVAPDTPHLVDACALFTGRSDPCPCGSGRRFKSCHGMRPAGA